MTPKKPIFLVIGVIQEPKHRRVIFLALSLHTSFVPGEPNVYGFEGARRIANYYQIPNVVSEECVRALNQQDTFDM